MIKVALHNLFNLIQKFLSSKLVIFSSWLFIGGISTGLLGYIFQVVMGRMLTLQEYGLFVAVMATIAILGAPLSTFNMIISRKISDYYVNNDFDSITNLYYVSSISALLITVIILIIGLLNMEHIASYLEVSNVNLIYMLFGIVLLSFLQSVNNGFLQGLKFFIWLAFSGSLSIFIKTVIAILFVWLGFGVFGVLGAIVISAVITWMITYNILKKSINKRNNKQFNLSHFSIKADLPVLLANISFVVMTQMDILLVKYYFSEEEMGIYAAASILGKAIMYLPGGVATAMFPLVAEDYNAGLSSRNTLFQSLCFTTLLSGLGAIFYYFYADWFVGLLYGEKYNASGEILKIFGFAIFPMALVMVTENFLIAKGRVLFAYIFLFFTPFQFVAIYFFHDTLLTVVTILGVSGLLLLFSGFVILFKSYIKEQRQTV